MAVDIRKKQKENLKRYGYETLTTYQQRRQIDAIIASLEVTGEGDVIEHVKNHRYKYLTIAISRERDERVNSPQNSKKP